MRLQIPRLTTGKTPKRNVKGRIAKLVGQLDDGRIDQMDRLFLTRLQQCSGFHVIRTSGINKENTQGPASKGSRGTCSNCSAQTSDYCLDCHRWLCNNTRSDKASKLAGWKSHIIISNPIIGNSEDIHCQATCMLVGHKDQQTAALKALESELVNSEMSGRGAVVG